LNELKKRRKQMIKNIIGNDSNSNKGGLHQPDNTLRKEFLSTNNQMRGNNKNDSMGFLNER